MKEKEKGPEKDRNVLKNELKYLLRLLITVVLATAAALLFRRSSGLLAMFPAAAAICFAAAWIKVGIAVRGAAFAACVFAFNTVEQDDLPLALTYTALCLFTVTAFGIGVRIIKKRRKVAGIAVIAAGLTATLILNGIFIGNPFKAIEAQEKIDSYVAEVYPESFTEGNLAFGRLDITNVYYDLSTKTYAKGAVCSRLPTLPGVISCDSGGNMSDTLLKQLGSVIAENSRSAVYDILRQAFPDASFTVTADSIWRYPEKQLFEVGENDISGRINYIIRIGGIQTVSEFRAEAEKFAEILDASGYKYCKTVFTAGISEWYRFSAVLVCGDHLPGDYKAEFRLRPKVSSDALDSLLNSLTEKAKTNYRSQIIGER